MSKINIWLCDHQHDNFPQLQISNGTQRQDQMFVIGVCHIYITNTPLSNEIQSRWCLVKCLRDKHVNGKQCKIAIIEVQKHQTTMWICNFCIRQGTQNWGLILSELNVSAKHELPTQNNKTLAEIPPLNAPVQMYLDCFLGFQCSSRIAGKVSLCCLISLTRNQCPKTIVKLKLINTCKLMSCCVSIMLQLSMYEQSINSENSNYVEQRCAIQWIKQAGGYWNHSLHLLLMEAHKFSKVMRISNMSLQNIPLGFYYIHLKYKCKKLKRKWSWNQPVKGKYRINSWKGEKKRVNKSEQTWKIKKINFYLLTFLTVIRKRNIA